jgi:hypothetical protein
VRLGVLLAKLGAADSGTTGRLKARIQLTGAGDSVHESLANSNGRMAFIMPAGTFWTRNVELSELDFGTFVQKMFEKKLTEPVRINCGLLAFTVRGGIAAADPILIDTTKNVIGGRGSFSFKDESLNLTIKADAKKFSLLSAQSPIVGLGLALVSPLAAVLAFVDPGDAEPTRCGPVLAGAGASAQRKQDGGAVQNVGAGKAAEDKPKKRKKFLGIF